MDGYKGDLFYVNMGGSPLTYGDVASTVGTLIGRREGPVRNPRSVAMNGASASTLATSAGLPESARIESISFSYGTIRVVVDESVPASEVHIRNADGALVGRLYGFADTP